MYRARRSAFYDNWSGFHGSFSSCEREAYNIPDSAARARRISTIKSFLLSAPSVYSRVFPAPSARARSFRLPLHCSAFYGKRMPVRLAFFVGRSPFLSASKSSNYSSGRATRRWILTSALNCPVLMNTCGDTCDDFRRNGVEHSKKFPLLALPGIV